MKTHQIEEIVNAFSKAWLGRNGVWGVELQSNKMDINFKSIVIYANLNDLKYDKIPHVYRGIQTTIKPVEKISTLAN